MTPNEAELIDVESHYPTDRVPMEMKEKSVAENLLDKMSETQSVLHPPLFPGAESFECVRKDRYGWADVVEEVGGEEKDAASVLQGSLSLVLPLAHLSKEAESQRV